MTHASPQTSYSNIAEHRAGDAISVYTGGVFVGRGGMKVGPLRPFRDEEDGATSDAAGRSAWFIAEGIGAYDRYGCILSGVTHESPLDCVALWPVEPIEIDLEILF
ncbi:hypothetical protein [Mesorhizobium sp. M6A.T.Cr.TU.016.01.1.1]|uniref:hypothetical protein n=1 Tax=Mesorhizobium sp. M6A.T.Cr.TU.016.01.1.1 TaxID=2493677 RepID=UPI000F763FFD|nr:hypothetical protein [Mesorhizobium sp. M6A.T.Cr.TU.016.01.1.1]AZO67670.1 hypothetical protein EJ075_23940 [Mesorhizobium sp. M6A.T.Cr.TU.016.01.1.1]